MTLLCILPVIMQMTSLAFAKQCMKIQSLKCQLLCLYLALAGIVSVDPPAHAEL